MSLPTTALFRDDLYLSTNEAVVTAVHQDGGIELDQTCFYATSGGQPGDTGFLERADGSIAVSLRLNHLTDVERRVLACGAHIEVLAPSELRRRIRAAATALLARYRE